MESYIKNKTTNDISTKNTEKSPKYWQRHSSDGSQF